MTGTSIHKHQEGKLLEFLEGIKWNLYISLGRAGFFITLSLTIHECGVSLHLLILQCLPLNTYISKNIKKMSILYI